MSAKKLVISTYLQYILIALGVLAQQLEGNVLMPRIMGGSFGVHTLCVLFATLAATALYGIVGAVFAVPIAAIITAARKPPVLVATEEGKPTCMDTAGVEIAGLRGSAWGEV